MCIHFDLLLFFFFLLFLRLRSLDVFCVCLWSQFVCVDEMLLVLGRMRTFTV